MTFMPFTLKHWNILIDGQSLAGKATEITLPAITPKIDNVNMYPTKLPVIVGYDSALIATITSAELSGQFAGLVGLENTTVVAMASTGNDSGIVVPQNYDNRNFPEIVKYGYIPVTQSASATLVGIVSSTTFSGWKSGDVTSDSFIITCKYFSFNGFGGSFTADFENNKFGANGSDMIEEIRGKIIL